jgi:hypothetical protein
MPIITRACLVKMFVESPEVFLYRDFIDSRKVINGLVVLVENELNRDAYTDDLFVFTIKLKTN